MYKAIKNLLYKLGFEVRRTKQPEISSGYFRNIHMIKGMERIKPFISPDVKTIVDIGAAEGSWALSAKEFWPDANFLLFEPLAERAEELNLLCNQNPGFYFIPSAAGKDEGGIQFAVTADLDGSGMAEGTKHNGEIRTVNVTSIDNQVKQLNLAGPYIIKLDTHGYEVPIIEGCVDIMDQVSLFIIECYGLQIAKDSLLFWEMCAFMDSKGFGLIDIIDVAHRPADNAFWQCDAFFIPKTSPQFKTKTFLV